ncbi:hypothetical protein BGZ83_002498 [Gryganskiella cystojenkinii]|nr:hypothetical protein BGZ83_002498 [Gryganskiella cystojenkinii]
MLVTLGKMHGFAGCAITLSAICLGFDLYRLAAGMTAGSWFYAAIFLADLLGCVSYAIVSLRNIKIETPIQRSRPWQIFCRVVFIVVALIAPVWQLKNAVLINDYVKQYLQAQREQPPTIATGDSGVRFLNYIRHLELEDSAAVCWGSLGSMLHSMEGSEIVTACNIAQARTVMILMAGFFALLETVLYAKSNVGSAEWVQDPKNLETKTKTRNVTTTAVPDLEMGNIVEPNRVSESITTLPNAHEGTAK